MIYVGVIVGALLFMISVRADGPADFIRFRAYVIGGLALIALGACIAWIDGQNILASLLLIDWKASGTSGIPLGYSLVLGGILDWIFNRKQKKERFTQK
jgi:hypothetical protein